MPRIDRDMQVGEALWILGVRGVNDFDAFMRDLFAKSYDVIIEEVKKLGMS